jgi:hypothetical protein
VPIATISAKPWLAAALNYDLASVAEAAAVRGEMPLAREARGIGYIADRPIRVPKKIARPRLVVPSRNGGATFRTKF